MPGRLYLLLHPRAPAQPRVALAAALPPRRLVCRAESCVGQGDNSVGYYSNRQHGRWAHMGGDGAGVSSLACYDAACYLSGALW